MAVAALPWKEILKGATLAVSLTRDLIKHQSSRPNQLAEAGSDPSSELAGLLQRVDALEIAGEAQAKVISLLAQEVQSLARRAMIGYWIGVAGLVVAVAAVAVSFLR